MKAELKLIVRVGLAIGLAAFALLGCDTGARKDLPVESQSFDESDTRVYLMPDGFPNLSHKCDDTTGMWTTTDRAVWILYGDPLCGGTGAEGQPQLVLDNIPGGPTTP